MRIRAVAVDDEPPALDRIRELLARDPVVEVVAACTDGRAAVAAVRQQAPDVMFLDIQMPEMDGFDVLAELVDTAMPIVVFTTAHEGYALRAFDVHALDYLLKPLDEAHFFATLQRVKEHVGTQQIAECNRRLHCLLEEVENRRRVLRRFVVPQPDGVRLLRTDEVEAIEADANYAVLHGAAASFRIRGTMGELEHRLDPRTFVRVHRCWIVNVGCVRELRRAFGSLRAAVLASGRRVPVARRGAKLLDTALGCTPTGGETAGRNRGAVSPLS